MLEDLKTLVREFDLKALVQPEHPEAFVTNLILLGIMVVCAVVVWKALSRLFA